LLDPGALGALWKFVTLTWLRLAWDDRVMKDTTDIRTRDLFTGATTSPWALPVWLRPTCVRLVQVTDKDGVIVTQRVIERADADGNFLAR
jgi:hypothetical protein